jgi:elongation factor Ts
MVSAIVDEDKNTGVVIGVNSETDFVAKNESFVEFVNKCANCAGTKTHLRGRALTLKSDDGFTVEQMLQEKILTIGEKLKIRRFARCEGVPVCYVHGGGKIGVVVNFKTDCAAKEGFKEYAKDIAMQVAAINPIYLKKEDVPADEIAKEKAILIAQIKGDPKMSSQAQQVIEKMVEGRLNKKFYQDSCLLEQPFVKDDKITVGQHTTNMRNRWMLDRNTLLCPF